MNFFFSHLLRCDSKEFVDSVFPIRHGIVFQLLIIQQLLRLFRIFAPGCIAAIRQIVTIFRKGRDRVPGLQKQLIIICEFQVGRLENLLPPDNWR